MKITPVLIVEEVEACLAFWVGRLGFTQVAVVPEGDKIGFAILVNDGTELMLQSVESVRKDHAAFAPDSTPSGVTLFIEVADFGDVLRRLEGYPVAMAERTTFYGMREIGVRSPAGNVVILACPQAQ